MALVKNKIPVLEYDSDKQSVIMPGHYFDYHFPERAVMLYMKEDIVQYVQEHECAQIGLFQGIPMNYPVYQTICNGVEIALVQAPLGGPGAAMTMEQLWAGGARKVIAAGCCGALLEDVEGEFYVPTAALRQEGTSYQYLPPSREVETDAKAVQAIAKAVADAGLRYRLCRTWTTDCFYRETKNMVNYRKEEGYAVVEMECASVAAVAKYRGIQFAQLLFTADSLANVEEHDMRNWGHDTFKVALHLALEAASRL